MIVEKYSGVSRSLPASRLPPIEPSSRPALSDDELNSGWKVSDEISVRHEGMPRSALQDDGRCEVKYPFGESGRLSFFRSFEPEEDTARRVKDDGTERAMISRVD